MIQFQSFLDHLPPEYDKYKDRLTQAIEHKMATHNDGNLRRFMKLLDNPFKQNTSHKMLDQSWVSVGKSSDLDAEQGKQLDSYIQGLMPWRKGPFELFENKIDTEWRSDFKWDRIIDKLGDLKHMNILDVGCGNGYHCLRMKAAGAKTVMGIDPAWLSVCQFQLINHFLQEPTVSVLPFTLEELPQDLKLFDMTFSMGVLYHRRSPLDHIAHLHSTLNAGGTLVLETMVIDGQLGEVLVPEGRYAQMNNIWFLPSVPTLISWCKKMGFEDVQCIEINQTSTSEQRSTQFKPGTSLQDYLDPTNPNLTIEGHPAPKRATIIAKKAKGRLKRYA
ncbi:MAG: tRNA 5-methoxyuridine(34)/uridine 5-oxyacetic acid(34) synthase CmoB [Saccharospirillaceae bacterium]|nr:tRNA 5-methoxyuridine(34)/uridine 5-oxyacetic acid(34) synthase CmoB [Pseudomonadales bacterium]NRB79801.1 tRNA 5-methoxyuridine(34)/uridine 5-oxyacetic acid(34) synthase CmoB [Saccharospirillaceae bacterium]